jgi:hypothetical protein
VFAAVELEVESLKVDAEPEKNEESLGTLLSKDLRRNSAKFAVFLFCAPLGLTILKMML